MEQTCPHDGKKLQVYETWTKNQVTLLWGKEKVKEVWLHCPGHPEAKYGPPGKRLVIAPGATYGYDVGFKVATLRFLESYSLQQIQNLFDVCIHQNIPTRTLCELSKKILDSIVGIHDQSASRMKQMFDSQGGYILQVDGSFEEEPPMLVVLKDAISECTLAAEMLPSESEENLRPLFEEIRRKYGSPLVVVRDGGDGIRKALEATFPDIPHLECHYHVLKNVGKDLFDGLYSEIVSLVQKFKVIPFVSKLCKRLQLVVAMIPETHKFCSQILYGKELPQLTSNKLLPLITSTFAVAIKDCLVREEKGSYPFALPFAKLYIYCRELLPSIHRYVSTLAEASKMYKPLSELETVLRDMVQDSVLSSRIAIIETLIRVFQETRTILRTKETINFQKYDPRWSQLQVSATRTKLQKYLIGLEREIRSLSVMNPRRIRCEKVIFLLNKKMKYLFVANQVVQVNGKQIEYRTPRTNNLLERTFWTIIRTLTKLKGRKRIRKAVHLYGKGIAILLNLKNPKYLQVVYPNGILPRFSEGAPLKESSNVISNPPKPTGLSRSILKLHLTHFSHRALAIMQREFSLPSEPPPPLPMPDPPPNGLLPS